MRIHRAKTLPARRPRPAAARRASLWCTVVSKVAVPGVDGDLAGELFGPAGTAGAGAPAVIVVPEVDGFSEGTRAAAQRLAGAGCVALALDLYAPLGAAPALRNREDTMAWLTRLDDRRQVSDLAQAVAWLKRFSGVDPTRIAVLGFSIGGRYAMMLATEPHGLRAVVAFYARPWPGAAIAEVALAPGDHVDGFEVPVCAVFGAEDDLVPPEMVERFRGLMDARTGRGHEVHIVPGRHYFANESRPRRYLQGSADEAWAIVLAFLAEQMGPFAV